MFKKHVIFEGYPDEGVILADIMQSYEQAELNNMMNRLNINMDSYILAQYNQFKTS